MIGKRRDLCDGESGLPWIIFLLVVLTTAVQPFGVRADDSDDGTNTPNPQAVAELRDGERTTANAAWWGFDPDDATEALQAAIRSGAKRVFVPNMGRPWIVRPIMLAGNQTLVLERGVEITAKRGEYRGGGDSVFTARDVSNLAIEGDGATVRMQKEDYITGIVLKDLDWHRWFGQYEKAEWRMALSLRGCSNVTVRGLTLRDSGGDGVYIDGGKNGPSRNIRLSNVVCDNNYRQGISVIDVDGLLVENSVFKNTWGTPPSSGVDIEPDGAEQVVRDVVFRNCRFEDNYGDGIEVFLSHVTRDVSILFDDCFVTSSRGSGIRVTKIKESGPGGLIEFRNCRVESTVGYGIKVQDKAADRGRVRFVNCIVRDAANNRQYAGAWAPVWLQSKLSARFGGIDFVNCAIEDDHDRAAIAVQMASGMRDVTGTIAVASPRDQPPSLDPNTSLVVKQTGRPSK